MAKQEITFQNFAGGVFSSKMRGRYEIQAANNGCRRMTNFIAETQGPATYRPPFLYVNATRRNNDPFLVPFQFNDEQAYMLEFTHLRMRVYKDGGLVLETAKNITGATQANPCVITSASHGYNNGDEVFIYSVGGMTQLNGKSFLVANKTANTFELTDTDGNNINSTAYGAYTSGGTVARVYEITTPYDEDLDLSLLKFKQNADTMYLTHPYYEQRKLTRTGHTSWILARFTRTNDPFLSKKVITGITQANPGVVTSASHGYENGDVVIIEEVVGMTEVNSKPYVVTNKTANTFDLYDLDGNAVNTSSYTAYSSAGFASNVNLLPSCLAFYEGRLYYGGIPKNPGKYIGSRGPDNTGVPRYDDFTSGTDADHAVYNNLADDEVNDILWLVSTDRLLFAGTFGSENKITGETSDKAITPTSVQARSIQKLGVANITPVNKENIVIYVQKGSLTVRSLEFDALSDSFISVDRNLLSDDIAYPGLTRIAWTSGRPDILWALRSDGVLLGLTFKSREDVSGWHVHNTYGGVDKIIDISAISRVDGYDQLWIVVERIVDGQTRRYVEYLDDYIKFPERDDFFTGEDNEEADTAKYERRLAELQRGVNYLDSSLEYDGSDQSVTITPAAVSGASVNFTASGSIFSATDVGRKIIKKSLTGDEYGRARIIEYTSATVVKCIIEDTFDSTDVIAAGDWYFTVGSVSGLEHLEGRTVQVVVDGAQHPDVVVTDGSITLEYQGGRIFVGLRYLGILQPMNLEFGGVTGAGQTKRRNIYRLGLKFHQTRGAKYGHDLYKLENVSFTNMPLQIGDPLALFTGVKEVPFQDSWENEPALYIVQAAPAPCQVQLIMVHGETDNE